MNNNLLIIGAGRYGLSAKETAEAMGCFGKISFLDDKVEKTVGDNKVLGKVNELDIFMSEYSNIFVAIANPKIKFSLIKTIKETTAYRIVTLISPRAYVSPSAQVMPGSLIEPMAVVNAGTVISEGCIIGAGSVVNHCSMCCAGVQLNCNATVSDKTLVPAGTFVDSGLIFKRDTVDTDDLFLNIES